MTKENVIIFLLYSLLGVAPKSEENEPLEADIKKREDELIKAAIDRAYLDTCRVFSVQETKKEYTHNAAVKEIKEAINEAVQKELEGKENYDSWHTKLCDKLVKIYSGKTVEKRHFTYGIAQKWVNMTMKYLCVMKSIFSEYGHEDKLKIWDFIDKNEKNFHIPIDSFILEAASEAGVELLRRKKSSQETEKHFGKYSNSYTQPWSQYDKCDYYNYQNNDEPLGLQNKLKNKLEELKKAPLDWESENWIRISDERKKMKTA